MGANGALHLSCPVGKRVVVAMRDGRIIHGKFEKKASQFIVVSGEKLPRAAIDSFILAKHVDIRRRGSDV
jgi:hypothetical protein